jgi:hypothetical protein
MKPTPHDTERRAPMARFVEFTNARTNKPVWVNPEHVRTAQAGSLQNNMIALAMGGEGQDVAVEGDLKSVLEELTGERDGPEVGGPRLKN